MAEPPKPVVPIKKSMTPDHMICLEDGKKFKSLKRHSNPLQHVASGVSCEVGSSVRLPDGSSKLSQTRSNLAKQMGLGQGRKKAAVPVVAESARKPGRRKPASVAA